MHLPPRSKSFRPHAAPLTAALLLAAVPLAQAESNPWYLGVSQTIGRESNLYHVSYDALLASPYSKSDTVYTTTLLGGLDQRFGRQALTANASVQNSRYQNNDHLDNTGYGLKARLDWETVNRISGLVSVNSSRALAQFNSRDSSGQLFTQRNTLSTNQIDTLARIGGVTKLTFEGGLGYLRRDYSAAFYHAYDQRQVYGTLGVRWRPSSALQLGVGLRRTNGSYPNFYQTSSGFAADDYRRTDIDLTANWTPSGNSTLYARVSPTRTRYDRDSARDLSGLTGALSWLWQATGKVQLNTQLSRDNGQSADIINLGPFGNGVIDYGRTTTALRVAATYAATAKITATANAGYIHRSLVDSSSVNGAPISQRAGSDNTLAFGLGARWQAMRSVQLGCDLNREQRNADSNLSWDYSANSFSCYGQFTLQ